MDRNEDPRDNGRAVGFRSAARFNAITGFAADGWSQTETASSRDRQRYFADLLESLCFTVERIERTSGELVQIWLLGDPATGERSGRFCSRKLSSVHRKRSGTSGCLALLRLGRGRRT